MSRPKISTPTTPAAAPTQAPLEAPKRELGDDERMTEEQRRRRGRSSLRIPSGAGRSNGPGVNIPMK